MDRLWAPWREKYVTQLIGKQKGDVFSKIARENNDKKNYIFVRTRHCFAVLNIFPYNNGHSLVLPYRKVRDLDQLTQEESLDLLELIKYTKDLLDEVMKPAGYNIGLNCGREAGAGFPDHLHFHIVPRWRGDVNFMPVIGKTKVISQSLDVIYRALVKAHRARQRKSAAPKSWPPQRTGKTSGRKKTRSRRQTA